MRTMFFVIIFLSSSLNLLFAQTKEVEEMWKSQIDTNKVNLGKPEYLQINEQQISKLIDNQPSFSMHHDNYFITGVPTNKAINKHTADAKFQISIRQRLTKTILPYNSFLMLTYTQKSFWNIYEKSAPFADNNYNPGLLVGKPIVYHNQLRGMASLAFEHESNGKDSLDNRSWNYFVASGAYFFNMCISVQAKLWGGLLSDENSDLYKYRGYGLVAFNYRSVSDRVWFSAIVNPRNGFRSFNTQLELSLKLDTKANQYLFFQWYNGYGESLLEYNQYTSMVRVGICMKPPLRNLY